MKYEELRKATLVYRPALLLDGFLSYAIRKKIQSLLFSIITVLFIVVVGVYLGEAQGVDSFGEARPKALGSFLIFFSGWLFFAISNAYYYSYVFRGMNMRLPETGEEGEPRISYPASTVVHFAKKDVTKAFLKSLYGASVLTRCGIVGDSVKEFLKTKDEPLPPSIFSVQVTKRGTATLADVARSIYENDHAFAGFLARNAVDKSEFIGASAWIEDIFEDWRYDTRFWSREKLGAIPGIGKDWSYGEVYKLEKYATDITNIGGPLNSSEAIFGKKEIGQRELLSIETVLSKNREANVILVGEDGGLKKDLVYRLARKIRNGSVLPALEHKKVFYFDPEILISNVDNKFDFEHELSELVLDAVKVGNIILVISNLPSLIEGGKRLGVDIVSLLDSYFSGTKLQVVALSNPVAFHNIIEQNSTLMRMFESITIDSGSEYGSLRTIQKYALSLESERDIFFTYPAVASVVKSAIRYFPTGVMPDKAIDLVSEIVPRVISENRTLVGKDDVLKLIEEKTGIPTGAPNEEEREKLLNLEKIIRKGVIGQDEAISAISNSLRRARSGIANPNRPMGSFLFFGPTGVGKTETAKALARTFFGGEDDIIRLDMSEYRTNDSLSRLIGVFGTSQSGILSSKLREKPYGILLLDEFEKTSPEVLDLFLQILDEGMFSDMVGKKVSARNLIIIATSNAGSDTVWEMSKENTVLDKNKIVDVIVERGIYKPELLNRFDGLVVFKPLGNEEIRVIARLMLGKLEKRLEEKGIQLIVTEDLVNYLSKVGYDPRFGARPMNRVIQDKVEKVVAEKMLRGEISAGSRVELTEGDLR